MSTTTNTGTRARWTAADIPDQTGRTFVVTGANSGIGLETAAELAGAGATVVLACRSLDKGERALEGLRARKPRGELALRRLDLADLASVRDFAEEIGREHPALDGLVNNAGVMALPRGRTADGFERQFGTNHLGHFALTGRLLPALLRASIRPQDRGPDPELLLRASAARVVTVSSIGHWAGRMDLDDLMRDRRYNRWLVYWQSKLANLLFTYELQRRLAAAGAPAIAVAAHPGGSQTELGRTGAVQSFLIAATSPFMAQPAAMGALPTLRAATDPSVEGGEYFGPDGPAQGRGYPVRVGSSRRSHDAETARRLWERSIQLTGVDPGI